MKKPEYLRWIIEEKAYISNCDCDVKCFEISYNNDPAILDDWALHIRRHYISDEELDDECINLETSAKDYLTENIIPSRTEQREKVARSFVITEILISDLLEFLEGYSVPRVRYYNLSSKSATVLGTDVIGYKYAAPDKTPSVNDELVLAEVKGKLASTDTSVINQAIEHSKLDEFRVSVSINHVRRKMNVLGYKQEAKELLRFQKKTSTDYRTEYIAAGITSLDSMSRMVINGKEVLVVPDVDGKDFVVGNNREIFFIHGRELMNLTHEIFDRCIK